MTVKISDLKFKHLPNLLNDLDISGIEANLIIEICVNILLNHKYGKKLTKEEFIDLYTAICSNGGFGLEEYIEYTMEERAFMFSPDKLKILKYLIK